MQISTGLSKEGILSAIPQQHPFRFIDDILEVDEDHIVAVTRFPASAFFYAGHFPNYPITPGVILLESMTQVGLVALGIYLLSLTSDPDFLNFHPMFSDGSFEFHASVFPETQVTIRAEKIFWRQRKLKSKVAMYRGDLLVANMITAGIAVKK